MQAAKDTVVEFHYTLSDAGKVVEENFGQEPMAILVGHKNIFPAVEEALMGKSAGDKFELTLTPEQAYGERKEDQPTQRIPIKHLQGAKKWRPGMVATVHTNQGTTQVTVVKVGKFNADCDVNHPLAGKTLDFSIEVALVREADAEEISHGHVHGRGGVHH